MARMSGPNPLAAVSMLGQFPPHHLASAHVAV